MLLSLGPRDGCGQLQVGTMMVGKKVVPFAKARTLQLQEARKHATLA